MKTQDFSINVTSKKLQESIAKKFGKTVSIEKYTREELEDIRNKFRTKLFQYESSAAFNELLSNEEYQRDKAILDLINTRIKEMLGEDIKKLRDKLATLSEAKKGVRAPKHTKKAKGTDQTGNGVGGEVDDIQVARMVAGGVPKKQAIARATSDNVKEGSKVHKGTYGTDPDAVDSKPLSGEVPDNPWHDSRAAKFLAKQVAGSPKNQKVAGRAQSAKQEEPGMKEAAKECNHSAKGKMCPVHGMKECGTMEAAVRKAKVKPSKGMTAKEKSAAVKQAKSGKDMGKPGKTFKDIEQAAGGGKKGKKIAGAAFWKGQAAKVKESNDIFRRHVGIVNESLAFLIQENEEEKAKAITAAGDIVNDYTSWMQRVGQYQTKAMVELADAIRSDFGPNEAETFKQAVGPALAATLETLMAQRETISNAVAVLAGEQMPTTPMGSQEGPAEPAITPTGPDTMNEPTDEFAAADAAAGGAETAGREVRESKFARKLAESHSILSKLAR